MHTKIVTLQDENSSRLTAYLCDSPLAYKPEFKAPAVIICPGGGFGPLSPREMEPIALKFVSEGISAFVLEYPVGDENVEFPATLLSAAMAVAHVRASAEGYHVVADQIAICGFSAGGYVAASLAAGWQRQEIAALLGMDNAQFKPNAAVLCYPVIDIEMQRGYMPNEYMGEDINLARAMRYRLLGKKSSYSKDEINSIALQKWVTKDTCPCFLWHTADDPVVHVDNSLQFAGALANYNVPFELHVFQSGLHGLALASQITATVAGHINPACEQWFGLSLAWLRSVFAPC